jgi:Domain of unknown function (DUF1906)
VLGLDYINGPPLASLKEAGVAFVCRYLSYVNDVTKAKILSPAEAKILSQATIAIVSNYEWYANRALEGSASGIQDAQIAEAQHKACGGPDDKPIYFSVDVDVDGSQVADYFRGVASVIGLSRTGAYGSYRVLQYLFDAGLISYGWQTYAWSSGQWEARAHIQQYENGANLAGASVDYDRSMQDNFGQWFYEQGEEKDVTITIDTPGVSAYFKQDDAQHWHCLSTGKTVQYGILSFYQSYGKDALCGLTYLGLPLSNEIPLDSAGNVKQYYERACVIYDPSHKYDNAPGSGSVYLAHVYSHDNSPVLGEDPLVAQIENQLAAVQKQLQSGADHQLLLQIKSVLASVS